MELAHILRQMWRRRTWLALVVVIAALTALAMNYRMSPWPPSISEDSIEFGASSTTMLVDAPRSPLADLGQTFDPLTARAGVYSRFMASPTVTAAIAEEAGLPAGSVVAEGPFNPKAQRSQREPSEERRATQLAEELGAHQLRFESEEGLPTVRIFAQAPSAESAATLANAVVPAFAAFIHGLETRNDVPKSQRVVISQLGEAQGTLVNEGADRAALLLTFLGLLIGGVLLVLVSSSVAEGWRTLDRINEQGGTPADPMQSASWAESAPTRNGRATAVESVRNPDG